MVSDEIERIEEGLDDEDELEEDERSHQLEPIELVLASDCGVERLDRALSTLPLGFSRTTLQRWIDEGRIWLDGERATRKSKAYPKANVRIEPAPPPPSDAIPEALPLVILHEDDDLIVVDKAAGMVVHPAPGHPGGTLVNAILYHCGLSGRGEGSRPGIVHRLDRDTSGVMVIAKTPTAKEGLMDLFATRTLERRYLAIALGAVATSATYDTLYGRHPSDRKRFSSRVGRGKRALTHVRRLRPLHGASLVECKLETGRTHQIRVHLADNGHPLLGDPVYGRPPRDPLLRKASAELGRQALHAALLAFRHPVTGEALRFQTDPPEDFRRALECLDREEHGSM